MIKYDLPIDVACVLGCIEEFGITKNSGSFSFKIWDPGRPPYPPLGLFPKFVRFFLIMAPLSQILIGSM